MIATKDRILFGHSFLNVTGQSIDTCLAKCLQECRCLSFQICEDDELCQLCSSRHGQSDVKWFQIRKGCTNFIFEREQSQVRNYNIGDVKNIILIFISASSYFKCLQFLDIVGIGHQK